MSELRWTLLILGVVFIAALSWWERRRPRQAFAPRLREASLSHADARWTASAEPPGGAEPWIGETGLSDVVSSDMSFTDADEDRAASGTGGMRADAEPSARGPLEELPTLVIADDEERLALEAAWDQEPPEPRLIDPEASAVAEAAAAAEAVAPATEAAIEPMHDEALQPLGDAAMEAMEPLRAETMDHESPAQAPGTTAPQAQAATAPAQPVPPVRIEPEIRGAEGVGAVRIVEPAPAAAPPPEPIVDWPPEESRRILALRLVAPQPERFPGRTLRLALAAEGFLLGKFAIFHKPDEANHAVLSAASLTRPGAFELESMDSQRYGGLSLFAVLPGPKAPQQAFEELLATARNLNERLQGALQDERGGPLTVLRVSSIRESLRAEAAATLPAAAAHGG